MVDWTPECQLAFDQLKDLCTSTPILAYADHKKPFQLQTDASDLGLGAVLYKVNDNKHQRVIAYASHSLSNTERNYLAHKLEFLVLKWAVMDRFHEYLYGGQFDVYTDKNPLTYILTSAKLMPQDKDGLLPWPIMTLGSFISQEIECGGGCAWSHSKDQQHPN